MATRRYSTDILLMFVAALSFTLLGVVTGATFYVILCGACLALITIELIATRGKRAE